MRRKLDTFKILFAAAAIAFASTVSAVHVHDITMCDHGSNVVVQNMHDLHDCIFCWVVYQTLSVDTGHAGSVFITSKPVFEDPQALPPSRFTFDRYGRDPPLLT